MINPVSIQDRIETDGAVVIRSVLSNAEIGRLKESLVQHFLRSGAEIDCGLHQARAAIECPAIGWIFSHPGVIAAIRQTMGTQDIVFTGNCDLHMNKLGNWHKDIETAHEKYFGDVFNASDWRIYKVGVYLQDHDLDGRGFRLRVGTQHSADKTVGKVEYLATRAGDLVVFDVRTTHAGALPDFIENVIWRGTRFLNRYRTGSSIGRNLKEFYWHCSGVAPRFAVFFTFGVRNISTEIFARLMLESQHAPTAISDNNSAGMPRDLVEKLAEKGVHTFEFT